MSSNIKSPSWFQQPSTYPYSPPPNPCRINALSEVNFPDAVPVSPPAQSPSLEYTSNLPPTTPDKPEEDRDTPAISNKNVHLKKPALKLNTALQTQYTQHSKNTDQDILLPALKLAFDKKSALSTKPACARDRPSRFMEGEASSSAPPNMEALKQCNPPQSSKRGWAWRRGIARGA